MSTPETVICADCGVEAAWWSLHPDGEVCRPCLAKRHARRVLADELAADDDLLRDAYDMLCALVESARSEPRDWWPLHNRLWARLEGDDATSTRAVTTGTGEGG